MLTFFLCLIALIVGYLVYGKFVDNIMGPDANRETPAYTKQDGVDYLPMPKWKLIFIQVLDIAGIGPIFGPILGAMYGPVALVWIVIGCIFAGSVHDYFSGMLSVRNGGASVPEIVGEYMGMPARQVMRVFSVILLLLVGVVFVLAPAKLLNGLTGIDVQILVACVFFYYFLATILPIDKIIGRFYPIMGILLLVMTVSLCIALFAGDYSILPNLDVTTNVHPGNKPVWPLLFITLSCGAISGFHSTQSPLMARCVKNEREGRSVFYGSMIIEGVIALIWATLGMSFYNSPEALSAVVAAGSPAAVVKEVSTTLLGGVGGMLAIVAVVVLPITSGDTAFRSTRLILAETFKMDQSLPAKRLTIAVPLFLIGYVISTQDFGMIWRYFGFANQTLAMLMLWAAAVYLIRTKKLHWIATIPATFMTAVCVTFILQAKIGFNLPMGISEIVGVVLAAAAFGFFMMKYGFGKAKPLQD
ncbi:carbon starvation CstA family protein [Desulfobaculum bizertense]|uniref:Carbon starvation protein CstA n=1 Tax=Desulfobaculum bizertense DSM 18034 TaxID=1121442 RepID=A0A1T4VYK7_9BACT|nr:carbon starvation protein A [Desulfobaculum bizertense]UIJ36971.1 carbon starvation protein A [Desulfobaculum bizertense]SKA69878.1 Carbon starvation protein CstA [Desulfobaculum bizertense DSM 18034]